MTKETRLSVNDLIYPLFVTDGVDIRHEIDPMPGIYRISLDHLIEEVEEIQKLGILGILIFGIPANKDPSGTEAYSPDGIVQKAVRMIKQEAPELLVFTDLCLCEYTTHGHCGVLENNVVQNDMTIDLLAETALAQAKSGSDVISPSAMMDGQVASIRTKLDNHGFTDTPIMAYSAKYASALYSPFREAAESTPEFGDRRGYQIDPANIREAISEISQDVEEGADMVMVKPALAYLDVISKARELFSKPIVAYSVSGEYTMVKAASINKWIDERPVVNELLTSIKRAGADIIITYHAKQFARWLC